MGAILDLYRNYNPDDYVEKDSEVCQMEDTFEENVTRLNEEERIAAENMYRAWKEKNRHVEDEIERFMRNKVDTITAIMELSDRMRVNNGKVEIKPDKFEKDETSNEEVRLLKEQNELLKELLLKKLQ